jgi:ribosomal protein S12 methylthiotransferase
MYIPDYDTPRFRLTPKHFGLHQDRRRLQPPVLLLHHPEDPWPHRSRSQESVVKEARDLVAAGVKEINLISQDTTYFGMDKWEGQRPNPRSGVDSSRGESLASLIRELNKPSRAIFGSACSTRTRRIGAMT